MLRLKFCTGHEAYDLFQGTPLIFVNFNYRLGPLGFPQGQEGVHISISLQKCLQVNTRVFKVTAMQTVVIMGSGSSLSTPQIVQYYD